MVTCEKFFVYRNRVHHEWGGYLRWCVAGSVLIS